MSEALNRALAEVAAPEVYALAGKKLGHLLPWEDQDPSIRETWIREEQEVIAPIVQALRVILEEDSPAGAELRGLLS